MSEGGQNEREMVVRATTRQPDDGNEQKRFARFKRFGIWLGLFGGELGIRVAVAKTEEKEAKAHTDAEQVRNLAARTDEQELKNTRVAFDLVDEAYPSEEEAQEAKKALLFEKFPELKAQADRINKLKHELRNEYGTTIEYEKEEHPRLEHHDRGDAVVDDDDLVVDDEDDFE